jgi:hypothetical protein
MKNPHFGRVFLACCLASLASVTVARGGVIPFDITNPTPRAVQIWGDDDPDPATYHVHMSPVVVGQWSSDGTTGVVRVDSAAMAALTAASGSTPIAVSDLTIAINLSSREVTGIEFYGLLSTTEFGDVQDVQFEYMMQSVPGPWTLHSGLVIPGSVGGFQDVAGSPVDPLFASDLFRPNGPGSDYTVVPTAPYDPATGFITAVGPLYTNWTDFGQIIVFDKTFGDLQLTEVVPEPASIVLLAAGLPVLAIMRCRARRRGGAS